MIAEFYRVFRGEGWGPQASLTIARGLIREPWRVDHFADFSPLKRALLAIFEARRTA
jgi:hypothetical protein